MSDGSAKAARPAADLRDRIMNANVAKSDSEWWAHDNIKGLLEALKGAVGALEFSRDYHNDLGNEDQAFAQDKLDAAVKAIAKAEARS